MGFTPPHPELRPLSPLTGFRRREGAKSCSGQSATGFSSRTAAGASGAVPATSLSSAGPVSGHKHHKPGEQAEPGPAPPGGRGRVLGGGPVPRPLPLLRAPRGHLPQLQLLPGPGPVQRPLRLSGEPAPTPSPGEHEHPGCGRQVTSCHIHCQVTHVHNCTSSKVFLFNVKV